MKFFLSALFFSFLITANGQVRLYVHLDSTVNRSFTGRLLVFTSTDTVRGVPDHPSISDPQPMYAVEVNNWDKTKVITIDDHVKCYSLEPSQLKPGSYSLAALLDADQGEHGGFNNGNYYTKKNTILHVAANGTGEAHLYLDKEIRRSFQENDSLKLVELKSKLLSGFHHKDIWIQAAVLLPQGYGAEAQKTYPVVYIIPGWGGTHFDAMGKAPQNRYGMREGLPKIYVYLNPQTQTPWGLHAFVDSRVNGPWGKALVEELVPYIRKNFRAAPDAAGTFIVGQSSGGYGALWLSLHYPQSFGGCWAVSPDPVDFTSFTGVNLYAPHANFYTDSSGRTVPFYLDNGKFLTTMKKALSVEFFNEDGGQQQSFEAEFGKAGPDGVPQPLFDRLTGAINPKIVQQWEAYDLARYIEQNWSRLKKYLSGKKIHVYAGAEDNFQLDKAVLALRQKADKVNADIVCEIIPKANHFTIWSPAFTTRVQQEMDNLIEQLSSEALSKHPSPKAISKEP